MHNIFSIGTNPANRRYNKYYTGTLAGHLFWIDNNLGITNSGQSSIWLFKNIERTIEIYNYINTPNSNLTLNDKRAIIDKHLILMMNDLDYFSFVVNHAQTGIANLVWWEDEAWISNPVNFELSVEQTYELNAAEKALVKIYPTRAYAISKNVPKAILETNVRFGTNGLNDKSDAFRHAFFNAMNERDCGKTSITLESIARKFSDAHETEVPPQLLKEKEMDLWNNNIGHQIGDVFFPIFTSDASLSNSVWDKNINGDLRYLKPVEATPPPGSNGINNDFWHINNDPLLGKHGITSLTLLTPTNQ